MEKLSYMDIKLKQKWFNNWIEVNIESINHEKASEFR
jgi:hypothetical protein